MKKYIAMLLSLIMVLSLFTFALPASAIYESDFYQVVLGAKYDTDAIKDFFDLFVAGYPSTDYYLLKPRDENLISNIANKIAFYSASSDSYETIHDSVYSLYDYNDASTSSFAAENLDVMLHFLETLLAYSNQTTNYPGGFEGIHEEIKSEFYSFPYIMCILNTMQNYGSRFISPDFSLFTYYADTLSLSEYANDIVYYSDSLIGFDNPEYLLSMLNEITLKTNRPTYNLEREAFVRFLNNSGNVVKIMSEEDFRSQYSELYDKFGYSFVAPKEMAAELAPTLSVSDEDSKNFLIKKALNEMATIEVSDSQPLVAIELERIQYAYLNALEFISALNGYGYSANVSDIEITFKFTGGSVQDLYQIAIPASTFNFFFYYGINKINFDSKLAEIDINIDEISHYLPAEAEDILFDVAYTSSLPNEYQIADGTPTLYFAINADGYQLSNLWKDGDVYMTPCQYTSGMDYYKVKNDGTRYTPSLYEENPDIKSVTFAVEPYTYYCLIPRTTSDANISETSTETDHWTSNTTIANLTSGRDEYIKQLENQQQQSSSLFTDLPDSHWAFPFIKELVEKEVLNGMGDGTFMPEANVTREQFIHMIVTAFNLTSDDTSSFDDVVKGSWYEKSVCVGKALGIINGVSDNAFGVGQNITRQDMATIAVRLYNDVLKADLTKYEGNEAKVFLDSDLISDYAKDGVALMQKMGIIDGFEDMTFRPTALATRAQSAKIISMLLSAVTE